MENGIARIKAGSRRQAMDWGLVLVSQGIESTVQFSEEAGGWVLVLAAQEQDRAREAIRIYQWENRHWPWRHPVFEAGLLFDWGSLAWVLLVCVFFWLSTGNPGMRATGIMDAGAVSRGEWWRLFTAIWLHADASHLASNVGLGFVLLGLTMGRYGTGLGLLAAYLAGAAGNVAVWLFWTKAGSLGASGMVMGSLGVLAAQSFAFKGLSPHARKYLLAGLFGGIMLFVLLGLDPASDTRAHIGGFVAGALVGALCTSFLRSRFQRAVDVWCGFIFALLVLLPWWFALRHF